ncbi:MAG: hypothetical protein EOM68_29720 [Spirochaetia bacterium]|nr:hypothetical protein [Spirochaetia bacterium]
MTMKLRFDRNSVRQITRDYKELKNMYQLLDDGYIDDVARGMETWMEELKTLKAKRRKQALDNGK